LITSVSPSGHKISIPQPDPGIFRATKVGSCSDIRRICAWGGPIQASDPATIKLTRSHLSPQNFGNFCGDFLPAIPDLFRLLFGFLAVAETP
jgi:hypothetical protein